MDARSYATMRAKLRKEGKWDETRKDKYKQTTLDDHLEDPLDISDQQHEAEAPGYNAAIDQAEGKSNLMSMQDANDASQSSDIHIETSSVACINESGAIYESLKTYSKNDLESENRGTREIPGGNLSIFYEGRNSQGKVRQIRGQVRDNKASSRTGQSGGINGISQTTGAIRDHVLIFDQDYSHPVYFKDYKKDKSWGDNEFYEGYFQTYNSLGVVIKSLPDDNITSYDVFKELCKCIPSEPFILISEKSDKGILHWHMIWLTCKRSDNAKRTLEGFLRPVSTNLSIAVQQTRSLKHLLKYILKDPISVGVANSNTFKLYTYGILDNEVYVKPEISSSNPMIKDLIDVMKAHNVYTSEELFKLAPETMLKYLHKPNLESIINNCKLFLLRPTDARHILQRAVQGREGTGFLPIWAWLLHQNIDPGDFVLDFWNIIFRATAKHNVLCIQGCSNTGKTTFIRPLMDILNFGEIVSGGQFMFQGCINKEILIWEEPLIGPDFVEMCKRVFEGMITQVPVKFKPPQTLYRTPIIITSNKDVWYYCSNDQTALSNRMIRYFANNDASAIPNSVDFRSRVVTSYNEWLEQLSKYVFDSQPTPPDGSKLGEPACSGSISQYSQQFSPTDKCSCAVCTERNQCISR